MDTIDAQARDARPLRLIMKGVHFAYAALIRPKSLDDDTQRKELILNSILCELIILMMLLDASTLYFRITRPQGTYQGVSPLSFSILLLLICALLALSRKGLHAFSSYILVIASLAGTAFSSYAWGMSLPAGLLAYAFIILISTILLGERFSLITLGCIVLIIIGLAHQESLVHLIPRWQCRPTHVASGFQYAVMLIFIGSLSLLYSQDIHRSLRRAQESEKDLKAERDSLEVKVASRTEELRQAQAEKLFQLYRFAEFGRLSSGLFHDLIGPLFTVALNIENLSAAVHPDLPSIKAHLDMSLRASKKMERFITTMKRQIQQNGQEEEFRLSSVIEDVIALLGYKSLKEGVEILFHLEGDIVAYGSPLKFQQIASNLIANAIDSYDGASNGLSDKKVTVRLWQEERRAFLSVQDKGAGIPAHLIDSIFNPFFTTKSSHKGMGLGLSTTKAAVEKDLRGTIRVESAEGLGSTFTISFPIVSPPHEQIQHEHIP